ncbi:pilus assembly PilX N-terminal domain-containing protein [Humisphaera borealis]|uniref:Pilus assembly PilX N-terminal domain-containing protein n=1 Tax=Humisphaera borealis TaxID=2807512 RepID=A0A7M2WXN6_9BACT|nr:pilus assembly PilX N-terminal domain-containing protein [Humisphaera borealis]QOV90114.1 pilus assembly PilX N-terminal domain-containing protein [Humisphaera borealis]
MSNRRRGVASMLAMLFLILFSVLAIGFYASSNMSAQVARNERVSADAQLAAESGLAFMRYQLGQVDIPVSTTNDAMFPAVTAELAKLLDGTTNMGGKTVQAVNGVVSIPGSSAWINLDSAGKQKFQASVTQSGAFLILTVIGQGPDPAITRTVRIKFQKAPRASALFDYGVASKGKIVTSGSSRIIGQGDPARGSILSTNMTDATPVVINGKEVSGDISIVNPTGSVSYSGASIGGTSNTILIQDHIHKGVQEPDFPDVDTSAYAAYAVTKYTGQKTLDNVYIPANTNPKFTGNTTIKGVLYIKAPNVVDFGGTVTIQGVIVVENGAALDLTKNQLNFTGNVNATGVETLPASYGGLRNLTGAFVLANNFYTSFSGNFGTVSGHIIASKIKFWGNAGGVVKGSVINMNDVQMDVGGSSQVTIASTGTSNYPTGVTFGAKFAPLPDTYVELPME